MINEYAPYQQPLINLSSRCYNCRIDILYSQQEVFSQGFLDNWLICLNMNMIK